MIDKNLSPQALRILIPVETGISLGYWKVVGPQFIDRGEIRLLPDGEALFQRPALGQLCNKSCPAGNNCCDVATKQKVARYVVEVTGIADVEGSSDGKMKKVQYSGKWKLDEFPESFRKAIGNVSPAFGARAIFQLYDDGWRIER
jgi:hypothetical protein